MGTAATQGLLAMLADSVRAAAAGILSKNKIVETTPEEFAHVVRFLASPLAGFITGEIIDQNGGLQVD